jgi:NAD(P)-dependent dehydrogenase (short-subunit alcohol dehydrogenase family)
MPTQQAPIGSGFDQRTTARDVLAGQNLEGKVIVVTGGHAGIGLETTRALAGAGATVVIGARNPEAARAATVKFGRVEADALELLDPASIDVFAARFVASGRPLHGLINNAGIMAAPLTRDARGFESQLATNHLGHFQLAARLWPALARAGSARVVALSSRGHMRSAFDFDDPHFERRPYDKWIAYGQSKTANVLFAVALDARGEAYGVRAFAVHPGAIATDLMRFMSEEERTAALERFSKISFVKNAEQGAATSVWCATSPRLDGMGGVYCENCDVAVPIDATVDSITGVRPWATDPDAAERLWALSERWTGVSFRP